LGGFGIDVWGLEIIWGLECLWVERQFEEIRCPTGR
jgi:hypothetical protein